MLMSSFDSWLHINLCLYSSPSTSFTIKHSLHHNAAALLVIMQLTNTRALEAVLKFYSQQCSLLSPILPCYIHSSTSPWDQVQSSSSLVNWRLASLYSLLIHWDTGAGLTSAWPMINSATFSTVDTCPSLRTWFRWTRTARGCTRARSGRYPPSGPSSVAAMSVPSQCPCKRCWRRWRRSTSGASETVNLQGQGELGMPYNKWSYGKYYANLRFQILLYALYLQP